MKTLKTFLKYQKVVFLCRNVNEIKEYMGNRCVNAKYSADWGYINGGMNKEKSKLEENDIVVVLPGWSFNNDVREFCPNYFEFDLSYD